MQVQTNDVVKLAANSSFLTGVLMAMLSPLSGMPTLGSQATTETKIEGSWSAIADGYSWSIHISEQTDDQGIYFRGVLIKPWPFFKSGEECLILRPTADPGVFEGKQKWKNILHISSWAPARVIVAGTSLVQYNSVHSSEHTLISPLWTYIRQADKTGKPKLPDVADKSSEGPTLSSTGSGFLINEHGQIVTNEHVVAGCASIKVRLGDEMVPVKLTSEDRENDLAVLSSSKDGTGFAEFSDAGLPKLGANVTTLGYPLRGILASSLNLTTGIVSSLAGLGGDTRMLQISAPVQSGNSGGPAIDSYGHIIGIVSSKLSGEKLEKATGNFSENVNFVIKASIVRNFLDAAQISYHTNKTDSVLDATVIGEKGNRYTVPIECFK